MESIIEQGTPIGTTGLTLRRLAIADVLKVVKIMLKVWKPGAKIDEGAASMAMMEAVLNNEEEIVSFVASLVNKTPEEFVKLSPDVLFDIGEALQKSEDIKSFLDKVKKLFAKMAASQIPPMSEEEEVAFMNKMKMKMKMGSPIAASPVNN
jgi:hypothetical protein